ncbi:phospholipase D-like domain-containing protein [Effusibacillus consociatus]|uniref:phospholipase D n=1 Tax=Effusibacillus consociatus TaxID=1117041 RepID=A0ABV9Q784_9BACL
MRKTALGILLLSSMLSSGCSELTKPTQGSSQMSTGRTLSESIYFTQADEHPERAIRSVIQNAKSTLDIAIYSITEDSIVKEIVNAKRRGVKVRVITDDQQVQNKYQNEDIRKLLSEGIPVKVNSHSGLMHLKMTVADRQVFAVGSFNYTKAASTTNDEVLIVLNDPQGAEKCGREFERMWNDSKEFRDFR